MARREHPRYENTEWPEYEFREYPMMVYPGAEDPSRPYNTKGKTRGKPLRGVIVNNDAERRAALELVDEDEAEDTGATRKALPTRGGKTMPTGSKGVDRMRTSDDEKEEILQEADILGIKVDKSWSVARIQDAIDTYKNTVV